MKWLTIAYNTLRLMYWFDAKLILLVVLSLITWRKWNVCYFHVNFYGVQGKKKELKKSNLMRKYAIQMNNIFSHSW